MVDFVDLVSDALPKQPDRSTAERPSYQYALIVAAAQLHVSCKLVEGPYVEPRQLARPLLAKYPLVD